MLRAEIIGNLGADAVVRRQNGEVYCTFNVADTQKFTDSDTGEVEERTSWVSVSINRDPGRLANFLTKGTKVYCRGNVSTRIFIGRDGKKHVGLNMYATEVELCGGVRLSVNDIFLFLAQHDEACEPVFDYLARSLDISALENFLEKYRDSAQSDAEIPETNPNA